MLTSGLSRALLIRLLQMNHRIHSRPLDVHNWSQHSELNLLVDRMWSALGEVRQSELIPKGNRQGTHYLKCMKKMNASKYLCLNMIYQKSTGTSFTQEDFKENLALQERVAAWHLIEIDKAIDELGDDVKAYDRDGLRAVSHLGEKTGMNKFVQSKGGYNPSDKLGTSLLDYYRKHSA